MRVAKTGTLRRQSSLQVNGQAFPSACPARENSLGFVRRLASPKTPKTKTAFQNGLLL
jgi:hypothetical protein